MKAILIILIIAGFIPNLVLSQLHCHRCFGNSYCNNVNHTDFASNVRNATCNPVTNLNEIEDPITKQLQMAINANFLSDLGDNQTSTRPFSFQSHCVTATIHEQHDTHTLRTCISRAVFTGSNATLCQALQIITEPQNINNGQLSCRECNGTNFCNEHILQVGDGIAEANQPQPSASMVISGSLGFVAAIVALYQLF